MIIVIVILGILAVVAMPKYADMQTEAKEAAADGVFGACQAAAAVNFAAGLAGATQPAGAVITTGTLLMGALDGTPEGWTVDDTGAAGAVGICTGTGASCVVGTADYSITISTFETSTAKAVLSKSW